MADNWPTCGNQEVYKLIAIYIPLDCHEANAWHSTGTEVAHVWQLFWPTTGPHVAINRYRNDNQEAHIWQ